MYSGRDLPGMPGRQGSENRTGNEQDKQCQSDNGQKLMANGSGKRQ